MSTSSKTSQPLNVVVGGGGPVGLTFSLNLTMMMGKHVKIIIYEGRWFVDRQNRIRWQSDEQGKIRREQIITLQDHVIEQMPEYIKNGLFPNKNINERVWPTSMNIPIREIEDRLFDLMQPFVQNGQIELIPENLHEQSECLIKGNFDILVGADGSDSFVRRYCNIQMVNEGVEYACGVAYNIPDGVAPEDEPLHQALNCILTVSQTRYLVNSLTSHRGYLNIRLIQSEYDELLECVRVFQSCRESLDLSDTNKCPQSPVWRIIRSGLELFKIPSKYVCRVEPIEINIRHASIVVRELHFEINQHGQSTKDSEEKKYKTALAFLVGDAAMNTHFWPGRGMNNGMKAAIALARNILRSCTSNNSIQIHTPLKFLNFLDYESFMARLRALEQQCRSLRILIDPVDKYTEASYSYINLNHDYKTYTKKLIEKLKETRKRLQEHPGWPYKSRPVTDDELQAVSSRIAPQNIAHLSLTNPWTTREVSGVEVLVEDIFPYDLTKVLTPPPLNSVIVLLRPPTLSIRYRFITLWIIGDKKLETIDNLIQDIQQSPSFTKTSKNKDTVYELHVVETIEKAKEWIKSHQELLGKSNTRFRVITIRKIKDDRTVVDVIRAVRSESPQVPILIFTSKHEEIQPALEFPNVLATDAEYELKGFVGINQETQWNSGCEVLSSATLSSSVISKPRGALPLSQSSQSSIDSPTLPVPSNFVLPPNSSPATGMRGVQNSLPSNSSPATKTRGAQNSPPPSVPQSKPILLWIDLETSDPKVLNDIRKNHPTLEISFISTYWGLEQYLNKNLDDIQQREKVIIICRGYYALESKNFVDVARLFGNCNPGKTYIGVYTKSRTDLLAKVSNLPQGIDIFETRKDFLSFIDRSLIQHF